jgi:hypothetical protein
MNRSVEIPIFVREIRPRFSSNCIQTNLVFRCISAVFSWPRPAFGNKKLNKYKKAQKQFAETDHYLTLYDL